VWKLFFQAFVISVSIHVAGLRNNFQNNYAGLSGYTPNII